MRNTFTALACIALLAAFCTPLLADPRPQEKIIMDKRKIISEVLEAQASRVPRHEKIWES